MAQENFPAALAAVLVHEGGYVNHPQDPGGATNKGVTQAVYEGYRGLRGVPFRSVREISDSEIHAIYRFQYWDRIRGDDLPAGLDYAVFDFAVNSGTHRAAAFLQRSVSQVDDGKIGPATLAAVKTADATQLIDELCDSRQRFLRGLSTFPVFGKGWLTRVKDVREKAKGMVA